MEHNVYVYILIMFGVAYLLRTLPLTLIRGEIKNRRIKSFLYYVPYVTLAVMTFPAILYASASPIPGLVALLIGMVVAWKGGGLFPTAIVCALAVFLVDFIAK